MAEFLSLAEDLTSTTLDDFPPSYSEATTSSSFRIPLSSSSSNPSISSNLYPSSNPSTSTTTATPLPPSFTASLTSPISAHLQSFLSRLRSSQQALANTRALHDLSAITALTPHIESFLQDLGNSLTPPPKGIAELTLIPSSAVPRGWALSDGLERKKEGEVIRVSRVDIPLPEDDTKGREKGREKGGEKGGEKGRDSKEGRRTTREEDDDDDDDDDEGYTYTGSRSYGFDEWGRIRDGEDGEEEEVGKGTFFRDGRQARRLAGYLHPGKVDGIVVTERKQVQQAVVDAKKESGRLGIKWGRKKSTGAAEQGDEVSMTVRAEEVTFRKENDFGVWESRSGYGIVVTVRVRRS